MARFASGKVSPLADLAGDSRPPGSDDAVRLGARRSARGLVGFGYPWAFAAPILITLGIPDLDAVRVAAIANNAPVSYGALGAPIIALAAVTGYPLMALSASVGHIVAILALLPPWVLIYLVSGKEGLKDGWPLAIVGSLGYIAGQFPVAVYLGPYLPDVTGAIVCFGALLLLLKVWRPRRVMGYGGQLAPAGELATNSHGLAAGEIFQGWLPIIVLVIVVVAWTGPWSKLPAVNWFHAAVTAQSSVAPGATISAAFDFKPAVGGTAILVSWIIIALLLGVNGEQFNAIWKKTWQQMWVHAWSAFSSLDSPTCTTIPAWQARWQRPFPNLAWSSSSWHRS